MNARPATLGELRQSRYSEERYKKRTVKDEMRENLICLLDREARLPAFRATLQPLRQALKARDFLGGAGPDYADFIVFGAFMWARSVSPLRVLEPNDTLFAWRERMLDLHGGMARRAPCFGA